MVGPPTYPAPMQHIFVPSIVPSGSSFFLRANPCTFGSASFPNLRNLRRTLRSSGLYPGRCLLSRRAPCGRFGLVRISLLPSTPSISHRYLSHDLDGFSLGFPPRPLGRVGLPFFQATTPPKADASESFFSDWPEGRSGKHHPSLDLERKALVGCSWLKSNLAVDGSDQTREDRIRGVPKATLSLPVHSRLRVRRARMDKKGEGLPWTSLCQIWWWK